MKHSKKGSRGPRLYFSHFQNRILCAFLLCTLIPIFIIGGISYAVSYNIAKDKILNASISADAQLHTQFDNRLQQVENIADTLQYNMYNLMQADAPMDTLAMLSEIRSNLSMFKTSFDLAYINIFLPDEHMASSESLYFFPMSKLSDFQIPKEVLENHAKHAYTDQKYPPDNPDLSSADDSGCGSDLEESYQTNQDTIQGYGNTTIRCIRHQHEGTGTTGSCT